MTTTFLGRLAAVCVAASTIAVALILLYRTNPSQAADPPASTADTFSPYVGADGSISRPTDYREKFTFLGTYADATKPGQSVDEIHNVYAPIDDIKAYQRDGKFPDGTVLVKEVCSARHGQTYDRTSSLGQRYKALVRDGQGFQGSFPWQWPVGRWLGLGVVQSQRARTERSDEL